MISITYYTNSTASIKRHLHVPDVIANGGLSEELGRICLETQGGDQEESAVPKTVPRNVFLDRSRSPGL